MRVCTKCGIPKPTEDYHKEKRTLDGCKAVCKKCHSKICIENSNKRRLLNPKPKVLKEKIKKGKSQSTIDNDRIRAKLYRENPVNKQKLKDYKKKWHQENKERLNKKSIEYHSDPENAKRRKEYLKQYNPMRRILTKEKREKDPLHRFKELLRAGVYRAFQSKGWGKTGKSSEILGCDFETVKKHIERQFTKGMSWDKIGSEIHIDHKIPINSAKNEEEVKLLCHYRNLQPLWKIDNLRKNSKILPVQTNLPL